MDVPDAEMGEERDDVSSEGFEAQEQTPFEVL